MTAVEYRIVYFTPDPFLGSRLAVAALLRTSQGVQAVVPTVPLDAARAGGGDAAFLVQAALRNLEGARSLDQLPSGLGPHFTLAADIRTMPSQVGEPAAWLASVLSGSK